MKSLVFVGTSTSEDFPHSIVLISLFSAFRQADYTLRKGTTEVLSTNVKKIEFDIVNEKVQTTTTTGKGEAMELA